MRWVLTFFDCLNMREFHTREDGSGLMHCVSIMLTTMSGRLKSVSWASSFQAPTGSWLLFQRNVDSHLNNLNLSDLCTELGRSWKEWNGKRQSLTVSLNVNAAVVGAKVIHGNGISSKGSLKFAGAATGNVYGSFKKSSQHASSFSPMESKG